MSLQTLEKFIDKKIDPVAAYLKGTIKAEGNLEQVLEIAKYDNIVKQQCRPENGRYC